MPKKLKVLSIFGTRPEAIKMAPVIHELNKYPDRIISRICVTAQHREMLDQVLALFDIQPDYDLNLMKEDQTLTEVAVLVLSKLEPILKSENPDWVLVQGDTTTAMAASLAAFYAHVKVAHVEAGLRTHDHWKPFPEEINRQLTGVLANLHFAPTENAQKNLMREGVQKEKIFLTGNTIIDALYWVAEQQSRFNGTSEEQGTNQEVFRYQKEGKKIILVTAHRRENLGKPLENICLALKDIAKRYEDDVQIIYPVHLNPAVQEPALRILGHLPNVQLLPPLDYLPLVHLMKESYLVLTDSGGLQEEAPALGKPVLVLRDTTERIEAVKAGTVRLIGTNRKEIVSEVSQLLNNARHYQKMSRAINPYGDGQAAKRIVAALLEGK